MTHPWRAVVASDLTAASDDALSRACLLAAEQRGAVTAVHVAVPDETEYEPDEAQLLLRQRLAGVLREHPGVSGEVHIAEGRAFVEIIRTARSVQADLIVVGAHGSDDAPAPLLGTTAERVVRKADRPVLVVRTPARHPYRRCLVGIDFSDASVDALTQASKLAPTADLELLHAFSVTGWKKLHASGAGESERRELARRVEQEAAKRLADLLRSQGRSRADVVVLVQEGPPSRLLVQVAAQRQVDLVAVGTRGASAIRQVLLGSVAEHAIRDAPCDVLAVRCSAPDFELP